MTDASLPPWPNTSDTSMRFARADEWAALSLAYRLRMEALIRYADHTHDCFQADEERCTCGLDELLAACERETT